MSELDVRIVKLEPMRVASALGFGTEPENQAWEAILDFAKAKGLNPESKQHRFFGFNNPNPSPGSENYGYEQWMTVGLDVEAEEPVKIKDVPGGLYAVTRFKGLENIGKTWQQLVHWFEDSVYKKPPNYDRCLEELLSPPGSSQGEWVFDLYLPIAE